VLPARVAVPSVWDSSVALMAIVEALLAEATQLDWDYGQKRMRELEAVRDTAPLAGRSVGAANKSSVRRPAAGKR
jgi:DNA-binding MurR/RpiR family transcriptional regulator